MSDNTVDDALDDIFDEKIPEKVTTSDKKDKEIEETKKKQDSDVLPGVGVDVGTSNIVVARQTVDGTFVNRYHRDMLYPLEASDETQDLLDRSDYLYVKAGNKFYIVGDDAVKLRNAINEGEIVRPMKDGLLNPSLKESSELLFYIIKAVVGDPIVPNEPLRFSVPANPVDQDYDNKFHQMVLTSFFKKLGYDPKPVNEAMAICYDCNPIMKSEEEGDVPLSGISVSCLTPDMPIVTSKGIVNIGDINVGDKVLTKGGTYEDVEEVVSNKVDKEIRCITYYSSNVPLKITSDHLIYSKSKDGSEGWVEAGKLNPKDWVMMPSLKSNGKKQYMRFKKRITCSKKTKKVEVYEASERLSRFIGLFLGDGHVYLPNGGVFFDFGSHEQELINFVESVAIDTFNNSMSFIKKGDNCIRCQMNNKGLAKWLDRMCYDENRQKVIPWNLDDTKRSTRLGLLRGLLESDGSFGTETISFENTSSNLVAGVMTICNSEGITGSYSERNRINLHLEGNPISNLSSFVVNAKFVSMLNFLFKNNNEKHSSRTDLDIVQWNRVRSNEAIKYKGEVIDLKVKNDHSFCLPGCCVHNCGGGMTNIALSFKGMELSSFSVTKSGDYIDDSAAKVTGMSSTKILRKKEKELDLTTPDMTDNVLSALYIYYEEVISRFLHQMSKAFNDKGTEIEGSVEIVVAGGTSLPNGFCEMIESKLEDYSFPFEIHGVRHSETPFYSVSQGSCIRGQADYKKKNS